MQDNYQSNQPLYTAQPVGFSLQGLKSRLCCPRVYTWVVFGLNVLGIFNYIKYGAVTILLSIIGCVLSFLVALFVTQSADTGDVRKYNWALYICIGCFAFICLECILSCIILFPQIEEAARKQYSEQDQINQVVLGAKILLIVISAIVIGIDSITLCVLCCYKKEFDGLPIPSNQPIASPEV